MTRLSPPDDARLWPGLTASTTHTRKPAWCNRYAVQMPKTPDPTTKTSNFGLAAAARCDATETESPIPPRPFRKFLRDDFCCFLFIIYSARRAAVWSSSVRLVANKKRTRFIEIGCFGSVAGILQRNNRMTAEGRKQSVVTKSCSRCLHPMA